LDDGDDLCNHLEMLVKSIEEGEPSSNGHAKGDRAVALRRLVAVLRAAAPDGCDERIRRIRRKLTGPAARGSNGPHHHFELAARDSEDQPSNHGVSGQ